MWTLGRRCTRWSSRANCIRSNSRCCSISEYNNAEPVVCSSNLTVHYHAVTRLAQNIPAPMLTCPFVSSCMLRECRVLHCSPPKGPNMQHRCAAQPSPTAAAPAWSRQHFATSIARYQYDALRQHLSFMYLCATSLRCSPMHFSHINGAGAPPPLLPCFWRPSAAAHDTVALKNSFGASLCDLRL